MESSRGRIPGFRDVLIVTSLVRGRGDLVLRRQVIGLTMYESFCLSVKQNLTRNS